MILLNLRTAKKDAKKAIKIWRSVKKKHRKCTWYLLSSGCVDVDNFIIRKLSDRQDIVFISYHSPDRKVVRFFVEYIDRTQYEKLLTYYSFFKFDNNLICLNLFKPYGQFCEKLMQILNMTAEEIADYILECNGIT